MFSAEQIADLLFKKFITGKGMSSMEKEYFQEALSSTPRVYEKNVWADAIPDTNPLENSGEGEIWNNHEGRAVLLKKVLLELEHIEGSTAFTHPLLKDVVDFNYGDGSYNYGIYLPDGLTRLAVGAKKWFLDPDAGILNFFDGFPEGVNALLPPKITCVIYVGLKGRNDNAGEKVHIVDVTEYNTKLSDEELLVNQPIGTSEILNTSESDEILKTINETSGGVRINHKGEIWYVTAEDPSVLIKKYDDKVIRHRVSDYITGLTNSNIQHFTLSPAGVVYSIVGSPATLWRFDGHTSHITPVTELNGFFIKDIKVSGGKITILYGENSSGEPGADELYVVSGYAEAGYFDDSGNSNDNGGIFLTDMNGTEKRFLTLPVGEFTPLKLTVYNNVTYVLMSHSVTSEKFWYKYENEIWTDLNFNADTESFVDIPDNINIINIAADSTGNVYSFNPSSPLKIKKMSFNGSSSAVIYDIMNEAEVSGNYNNIRSFVIEKDFLYVAGTGLVLKMNLNNLQYELFLNEDGYELNGSSGEYIGLYQNQPFFTNSISLIHKFGFRPVRILLPVNVYENKTIRVHDKTGGAYLSNITIDGNGKEIENSTKALINTAYGDLSLLYHDGAWIVRDGNT